jgi:hypothetical protein
MLGSRIKIPSLTLNDYFACFSRCEPSAKVLKKEPKKFDSLVENAKKTKNGAPIAAADAVYESRFFLISVSHERAAADKYYTHTRMCE